ncbi:hypothetical protein [Nakamurella sp.]|uniref:hypothetical protein n=1 Tax=Nakamurella sp. TaxID=1869182 RepID=UPI003B3A17DE
MAAGLVDAIGHQLAADIAVHARDEATVQALMARARALVGDETFPKVLYVALGTLAVGVVGPVLEASDAAGWPVAPMLRDQAEQIRRMVDRQVKR